ncbi:hypothetical protein HNR46_001491 [Haloferula luteola]|uniref:F5/8 type C domain-containing protein n=1 Tax=Haloferula luteola TaxID=595692 RepID=A0A840UZT6_9BACT|nr:BNR-4 repeat-containing protein [Haloferula luteola]MBB5351255.1 hypothetical protein [Haloferula luteola]
MKSATFLYLTSSLGSLMAPALTAQSVSPHIADSGTVILYHMDEATGATQVVDAAGGFNGVATSGETATSIFSGDAGYSGFGTAGTNTATTGVGVDVTGDGVFHYDDNATAPDTFDTLNKLGDTFTLEAMIRPAAITGTNQHLWGIDGTVSRALQFRINSDGTLNFDPIDGGGAAVTFSLTSLTGAHAFVANEWYHVAAVYDQGTVSLYWTRVDSGAEVANLVATGTTSVSFQSDDSPLMFGNEGRSFGGTSEGLIGRLDEGRVSRVARAANEFIFDSVQVHDWSSYEAGSTNVPANTLDGDLATRWSAEGDGSWISFDLGKNREVTAIDLAFFNGTTRISTFDVELSMDGVVWRPALVSQTSSGTTTALESFALTGNTIARYIRYVGYGNTVNDWNSITEVEVQSQALVDTDQDGLPDLFEQWVIDANPDDAITSLADVLPDDDFDGDDQTNRDEYLAGSDPTIYNEPGDIDDDGLPDFWEARWFGDLNETAEGDSDGDGFSNLEEYEGGSDPTSFSSKPGDLDGDGLPDAWEQEQFGTLDNNAYSDPDSDGYVNIGEYVAATNANDVSSKPSWKAPSVAYMGNSVVATNACIMPQSAVYGRAINGLSFQDQILYTFDGYQYTAYYDSIGSVQMVVVARRTVSGASVGEWEIYRTDSEFTNGDESGVGTSWDAHNVVAFGICESDGSLHFSYDHHGHTLRYRRSIAGLCTTQKDAWGAGMLQAEQNWIVSLSQVQTEVTYPQFVPSPDGGLTFVWRNGSSGNGDQFFSHYQPATSNWSTPTRFIERSGNYNGSASRCPYINGFDYAPDGSMHVTWTWREGAGSSNHDICYAYSEDRGVTWKNTAGAVVADTSLGEDIDLNTPGISFKPTDLNQLLINQQTQCVDEDGRVHAMMLHRREDAGFEYPNVTTNVYSTLGVAYYHYFLEPGTGRWQQRRIPPEVFQVGSRPAIAYDAAGNVYAAFTTYTTGVNVFPGYSAGRLAIASASKESEYTDWKVQQVVEVTNAFTGEPLIDQARLLRDGVLSVYIQENSTSSAAGTTPLHVYEFAVDVAEPLETGLSGISRVGDDVVVTTYGSAGAVYQLQKSTDLVSDWTSVGETYTGTNALLAAPDSQGWSLSRAFYRFQVTTP